MSIQTTALEHSLNVLRREIADEFDGLSLLFVLHAPSQRTEALARKKDEIREHPAGAALYETLAKNAAHGTEESFFGGMAHATVPLYFGLTKKNAFIAVIFINTGDIEENEHIAFSTKHLAYSLIWEMLDLYQIYLAKPSDFSGRVVLERQRSPIEWLRSKMLADCFSTMAMESAGEKNAIQRIIKKRCESCVTPIPAYYPENYPFPLALDATLLVYKDLKDAAPPKSGPLAHTMFMTREIGETYEDASLTQWVTFCKAAQEMAWTGHNKTEILGAAVYSNEDAYIRSTAYIVAETLNTDPVPLKHHDFYNPFADDAVNERLHLKRAKATFVEVIERAAVQDDPGEILMALRRANADLLDGNPAGWCAPALLRAYQIYKNPPDQNTTPAEQASATFHEALAETPWSLIAKLHKTLIDERRGGTKLTPDLAAEIAKCEEDIAPFAEALSAHP